MCYDLVKGHAGLKILWCGFYILTTSAHSNVLVYERVTSYSSVETQS